MPKLNRRFLLRGMFQGSAGLVALPLLDCFLDGNGQALAATKAPIPTRFGTYFYGCGLEKELWVPKTIGADFETTPQLKSIEPFNKKLNLFSGLRAITDGKPNHQHWTGLAATVSGVAPDLRDAFNAETLDVTIARTLGKGTRFKSIEVSCSGSSAMTFSSLGGRNNNPPETSPSSLYARVFGNGFQDPSKGGWKVDPQILMRQSILSVVADDRKRLMGAVGRSDQARLDQYFTSVRQVEDQILAESQPPVMTAHVTIPGAPQELPVNTSVPVLQRTAEMMSQLLAIALATGQTNVFNMAYSFPNSSTYLPGDSRTCHVHTHEESVDAKLGYQPIAAKFGEYSIEALAALLKALDGVPEGDGTLLDHSLILSYSDSSVARIHSINGLPIFLAGLASGKVKGGHHMTETGSPCTRVGLTIQQALGMPVESWGEGSLKTNRALTEILA